MKLTLKLFYRNNLSQVNVSNLFFTPKGFEPIFEANLNYYIHSLIKAKNLRLIFVKYFVYTWRDSNPRPLGSKPSALSAELQVRVLPF